MPVLAKIDHIHIYTPDVLEAEKWYTDVLGFERIESLMPWFEEGGALTIGNGGVHLALFDGDIRTSSTTAFAVDAQNYLAWKKHLKLNAVTYREADHRLSWSIYFSDPYGNQFEITTYER